MAQCPVAGREAQAPFEPVRELIRTRGLRFADFWFTDLSGRPWRITMPADAVNERLFNEGLPLDGQPVGGSWNGVMLLMPQADAVYADPAATAPTLAMICDTLDPRTLEPFFIGPRHVLKRAERQVHERLGGAAVTLGAEPEFILLESNGRPACEGAVWDFLRKLATLLGESGMRIDWYRTGPAIGQGRVQMHPGPALQIADHVMFHRHVAATLARWRGATASFLPHPVEGAGCAALPVHQAVWKDGRNLFHDDGGWALTSELCRHYAGGLLAHMPALLAFCAPTTNSYRRLIPGVRGPTDLLLSQTLRTAACRIPARSTEPGARRIKFWPADPTANPYLAFAAIIMAGLDGIERRLEAPVDGSEPWRTPFPHSLEASLDALSADRGFLKEGGVFTDAIVDSWIKDRWTHHVLPVRRKPHPWELLNADTFNRASAAEASV